MPPHERERSLHAAVAQFLRLALRPPTTWTTFPAGGGGLERGRLLARLGLRPGWPDILVLHPAPAAVDGGRRAIVLGLELKTETGRQSPAQRCVAADFDAAGAAYLLCRSLDDVQAALLRAGVPVAASLSGDYGRSPRSRRAPRPGAAGPCFFSTQSPPIVSLVHEEGRELPSSRSRGECA